jgi:hypothetical protein
MSCKKKIIDIYGFSILCLLKCMLPLVARDSSVGITTGYELDGPGIESWRGQDFPHLSRPALGPLILLYDGYRVFPGGKEQPGRDADPSEPHCLYEGGLYLFLLYVTS